MAQWDIGLADDCHCTEDFMMAPVRFSLPLVLKYPTVFEYTEQNVISSTIAYLIDSKMRKAVYLQDWLETQVLRSKESSVVMNMCNKIPSVIGYDDQVYEVFSYVWNNLKYIDDGTRWKTPEYWATPEETIKETQVVNGTKYGPMQGDCEDGAILIYVLCRIKGIPANRLMIWAGDVQESAVAPTGGHCCCFYKPIEYPLNFVSLDWCYYPKMLSMLYRNMFEFHKKDIIEFSKEKLGFTTVWSCYRSSWFFFNEDIAYNSFIYKFLGTQ